jgi:phosphatidylserine/phosphatidylglycerophosphate/cardiolipin synthase-like enzyme
VISVRDQSSFLGQAKPPAGYRLTYCVGTTFSLDLECLLQLALNSRGVESPLQDLKDKQLEAFTAVQDFQTKAIVFCQSCRIKESRFLLEETRGSKGIRKLLAALDSSVVAVPSPAFKATFHPKVWLFRYDGDTGKAPAVFTLCVQSRNLTASKDWDISTTFNGSLSRTKSRKHQPLIEFLEHLKHQAARGEKQELIQRAIDDASQIHFNSIPDFSERWEFFFRWPVYRDWALIDPSRYREIIAVSPFLGKSVATLQALSSVQKFTLITGPKDIDTIARVKGLAHRTYVMAGTDEAAWDAAVARPDQLGLHAKIYLGLNKSSDDVDVFVGSANLTDAAFRGRNCEAVVRLKCRLRHLRGFESEFIYKDRKKEILHPWLQNLEALIALQGGTDLKEDPSERLLEELRERISQGSFHLRFLKRKQQAVLRFASDKPIHLPKGTQAQFRLATSAEISPLEPVLSGAQQVFQASADERTEFLILRLTHGDHELRFVTVAGSDLNRSARSRTALHHLVKDADSFFQLLGLMLGATIPGSRAGGVPPREPKKPGPKSRKPASRFASEGQAFLEPLLLRGLMDREREEEIEAAIQAFLTAPHPSSQKKSVAQFEKVWARYRKASGALRRHGYVVFPA